MSALSQYLTRIDREVYSRLTELLNINFKRRDGYVGNTSVYKNVAVHNQCIYYSVVNEILLSNGGVCLSAHQVVFTHAEDMEYIDDILPTINAMMQDYMEQSEYLIFTMIITVDKYCWICNGHFVGSRMLEYDKTNIILYTKPGPDGYVITLDPIAKNLSYASSWGILKDIIEYYARG